MELFWAHSTMGVFILARYATLMFWPFFFKLEEEVPSPLFFFFFGLYIIFFFSSVRKLKVSFPPHPYFERNKKKREVGKKFRRRGALPLPLFFSGIGSQASLPPHFPPPPRSVYFPLTTLWQIIPGERKYSQKKKREIQHGGRGKKTTFFYFPFPFPLSFSSLNLNPPNLLMNRWVLFGRRRRELSDKLTWCGQRRRKGGGEKSTEGASFREPEALAHRHLKKIFRICQMTWFHCSWNYFPSQDQ